MYKPVAAAAAFACCFIGTMSASVACNGSAWDYVLISDQRIHLPQFFTQGDARYGDNLVSDVRSDSCGSEASARALVLSKPPKVMLPY